MPDTLATMRRQLLTYLMEDTDVQLCNDAISDAVESLWLSVIQVHLGQFLGGPIQNLTLAAGSERATIVSVADPVTQLSGATVVPVANGSGAPALPIRNLLFGYSFVTESGSETNIDYVSAGNGTPFQLQVDSTHLAQVTLPLYPKTPPGNPLGWNLYIAYDDQVPLTPDPLLMVRQNDQPLQFNQVWVEDPAGPTTDTGNPDLLHPTSNTTADNIFYIRVVEVQNPDSTWTRWDAANIDGLKMDRAVKTIAPATTYEHYAFDFVNGNTIEVRPAVGQTLSPRYFFIAKPRRLNFDRSPIPFTNLAYAEFIKMYSAAQCKRASREFTSASQDGNAAESTRISILKGLNIQATAKQKYITPYFRW